MALPIPFCSITESWEKKAKAGFEPMRAFDIAWKSKTELPSGQWVSVKPGLWTEIWTRFRTDAYFNNDHFQETADRRCSQGAGLEATCKHVEVESLENP